MSETDDTDELLLIPPDFFILNSELEVGPIDNVKPFFDVVDSLISQVNNLEDRVNFIQSTSDISLVESSYGSPRSMYDPGYRKFDSADELVNEMEYGSVSTQSTPQKPRSKFTNPSSLPNSPNVNQLYRRSLNQHEHGSQGEFKRPEIDHFVSTVRNMKRMSAVRNLEPEFNEKKKIDVAEVLKTFNLDDLEFKSKEKPFNKEKSSQYGDNVESVPNYGYGMRDLLYQQTTEPVQELFTTTKISNTSSDQSNIETKSSSSSETSHTTAFNKYTYAELKTPQTQDNKQVRIISEHNVPLKNEQNKDIFNLELVSLSNLWKSTNIEDMPLTFKQKLHEEKLRRQHCEQLIQKLQHRNLELQERLSVAIQVDDTKDNAILQFHKAWEKAVTKIQILHEEKHKLENRMKINEEEFKEELELATQKIISCEKEASKNKNLAENCQKNLEKLENRCDELRNKLQQTEKKFHEIQKQYNTELDKSKKYPEIITEKEFELCEIKKLLVQARQEVVESKKTVEVCQSELSLLKAENLELQQQLSEERRSGSELNEQKKNMQQEIDAHKNFTKSLQDELTKTRDQLVSNKLELKNFYQGQVELVVQTKLKEFQNQLNQAEHLLKNELKQKEIAIAKKAAIHIQQLSEKYDLEIKLLEQRHKEEINLHQIKAAKYQKELEDYKIKVQLEQERNNNFYKQVSKFIDSVKQDKNFGTSEELRSKSFTNLEEIILTIPSDDSKLNDTTDVQEFDNSAQYSYQMINETPKHQKNKQQKEGELKNLMDLLLDKTPGNHPILENVNQEKAIWKPSGEFNSHKSVQKEKRSDKRPWK